jgi:hypothetical protein
VAYYEKNTINASAAAVPPISSWQNTSNRVLKYSGFLTAHDVQKWVLRVYSILIGTCNSIEKSSYLSNYYNYYINEVPAY